MCKRMLITALAVAVCATTIVIAGGPAKDKGKEAKLEGRIVDIHNYMVGEYASTDRVKITRDAIQAGIPVLLETKEGVVILGMGKRGEKKMQIQPHAYAEVNVIGMLHEKKGLKYLDVQNVEPLKPAHPGDDDENEGEDEGQDRDEDEDSVDE